MTSRPCHNVGTRNVDSSGGLLPSSLPESRKCVNSNPIFSKLWPNKGVVKKIVYLTYWSLHGAKPWLLHRSASIPGPEDSERRREVGTHFRINTFADGSFASQLAKPKAKVWLGWLVKKSMCHAKRTPGEKIRCSSSPFVIASMMSSSSLGKSNWILTGDATVNAWHCTGICEHIYVFWKSLLNLFTQFTSAAHWKMKALI